MKVCRNRKVSDEDLHRIVERYIIQATGGEMPISLNENRDVRAFYRKIVQFRNFIVHRYERIDSAILVDISNNRLHDFEHFRDEVMLYVSHGIGQAQ